MNQPYRNGQNFLHNDDFIRWRLFRTAELDEYWGNFLIMNPHLKKDLQEAISRFNVLQLNHYPLSESEKKKIYHSVLQKTFQRTKKHGIFFIYSIAAVSIAVAFFLFYLIFFKEREQAPLLDNGDSIIGQTLPDEEIYLISGNGKIDIAHKSHISFEENGKALVTNDDDSPRELTLATTDFNNLVVPYGKRTNLTLSDGTEIWINSGTQLDFPSVFNDDKREIRVNGEIFINVAHDPQTPFVVIAQDMEIHVFGTTFNVSAYKDDSKKTIVLVGGKVKIETGGGQIAELLPNEKFEIMGGNMTKEHVNVSEYISWTKGFLEFDETPVSEILRKIGRYYNVQFESSQVIKLNDKTCSGKLFLSNNLDSVMTSVSILSSTVYHRENNTIHITKK